MCKFVMYNSVEFRLLSGVYVMDCLREETVPVSALLKKKVLNNLFFFFFTQNVFFIR